MRKLYSILSFVFFVSVSFGQDTKPTPASTPAPLDSDQVVKISTNLIQIDVNVTDKGGKIITDLKPSDFEILENGIKQEITNFSFVTAAGRRPESRTGKTKVEGLAIPVPSAQLRPELVKRTIAIVVDDLGLSFESINSVRKALRTFVDEQMQANDIVAIVRTSVGLGSLQQFTSDRRQLYAGIESLRWNVKGRAGVGAFASIEPSLSETLLASGLPLGTSPEAKKELEDRVIQERENAKIINQFREDIFTDGTLGAINYLVKGMNRQPGRKSLMLFSDGFSVCTAIRSERCNEIVTSMRRLTDLVNRASVSIYSFDARGTAVTALGADDQVIGQSIESGQVFQNSVRRTVAETLDDRSQALFTTQDGLAYLAKETGGRSFFNSNNLNKSLDAALEGENGYYLIGYDPDEETFDPSKLRYNKLEVKVNRKDVSLRYRSGFFGIEDTDSDSSNLTAGEELFRALTSPFGAKGIGVRINALFGLDREKGPYMRALMHADIRDLKFSDAVNGERQATVDILAVTYGEKNVPTNHLSKNITLTIKTEDYEKTIEDGFVYSFQFPIKKTGAYQFGIAIRDSGTGKAGSATQFFEVPKAAKDRLTMSGIVLQNYTLEQWKQSSRDPTAIIEGISSPISDTSERKFKRGSIVEYGAEIYNAKTRGGAVRLYKQVRIFHEGQLILDSGQIPLKTSEIGDSQRIHATGGVKLGLGMAFGDYILQVAIIDPLEKDKNKLTSGWVQFELVD